MISKPLLGNLDLDGMYKRRLEVIGLAHGACCDWIEVGHPSPLGLSLQMRVCCVVYPKIIGTDSAFVTRNLARSITLWDRIIVMGGRPGRLLRTFRSSSCAKCQVGELEGIAAFAQQRAFQDRLDQFLHDHRPVMGLSDDPIAHRGRVVLALGQFS
jgi:hypothetical protein